MQRSEELEWLKVHLSASEMVDEMTDVELPQHRALPNLINDSVKAFNSNGIRFIYDHFQTYLSIIVNENKLDWVPINKGFEYIERACQQLCAHLENLFKEKNLESDDRIDSLNCLRLLLYLYTNLMKVKDNKLAAEMAASLTLGKKGKKVAFSDNSSSDREWQENERRTALEVIYNLLQLPLHRLWDPPLADDAFVDMVSQPCYRMMEDTIIKSKTMRETVFQILGILNKKYNHGLSSTIKLVQMVQMYEHAVSPICVGVNQLVTVWNLTGLVARLVRELGETIGGNSGGQGDGANIGHAEGLPAQRQCAHFLIELTQLMPAQMIPAAQAMRSHLENDECYPLRSSILGMLCEILCKELKGEGLSEENRTLRDEFLDDLEEHLHDLSAYVRSKVLQYWCRLQREGCIPVNRQQRVLGRAIGRLEDKASLVRKSAVQLVKCFLEHNPFSAQLKVSQIEKQIALEREKLDELQKQLNVQLKNNPLLLKQWEEIEDEVKRVVEAKMSESSQECTQLTLNSVEDTYVAIRQQLLHKNYSEALAVIRYTERMYPEARLLRCELDKDDQVAYVINVLRNVFVTEVEDDTGDDEKKMELIKRHEEQESVVAFLEDCVAFSNLIQQAVPLIYTLLMSKQATDINEAIDFFTSAHCFSIETAKLGTMGMLQLVWSPDQEKRDAVDNAYRHIYLDQESNSDRTRAANTAQGLVRLVQSVNRGQAAALQALLGRWLQAGHLNNAVVQIFWEMFTLKHGDTSDDDSYAALNLLVMISKAKPSVAFANIEVIQTVGLSNTYRKKVLAARLLLSIGQMQQRFPVTDSLLKSLRDSLITTFFDSSQFSSFGTTVIDVIYALCDTPDLMCLDILKEITARINNDYKREENDVLLYPTEYVERLVVLLGSIAVQQLIYLDVTVYSELRRRNEVREQRKNTGTKKKLLKTTDKGNKSISTPALNSSSASAAGRARLLNQSSMSTAQTEADDGEDMGVEGAVADDTDAEGLRKVCEEEVVCAGILSLATPLLLNILQSTESQIPKKLKTAACLTLGRFMLVSSAFCEEHMQLLMTLLKTSECDVIKCNIVITLSDLTLRFPNVVQPWTHYIYARLDDPSVQVRQCTVKMLSYLILQEMVRVRGQVSSLARCCVDSDPNTRTMARLFFKQLSQKGNALYNVIPDIISRLSDTVLALPEDHFRTILKYIMSLIQKDRQMEALVEKLCLRFKLSADERQWRDLAYCLSLFNYNDRSIKKLIENIDCFKDKLFSKEVYNCFKTIISNTNKAAKADVKSAVAELNDKIEEYFATSENKDGENKENQKEKLATPAKKRGSSKRGRARKTNSDDSDEDLENFEDRTPRKSRQNASLSTRTPLRKRKTTTYNENDSNDSGSDSEEKETNKIPVFKKPTGKAVRKRK